MNIGELHLENPIKGELYSLERLEEYASFLANELKITEHPKLTQSLLPRMKENGVKLLETYRALTKAIHNKETIAPAGEWITDNFHIIEDQLREIKVDLPPSYYKELPKLAVGELRGYPRIYAISLALVAHTDSQLEPETIKRFIDSFQKVSPLRIGELWALSITLRLVLLENLRRISVRVTFDHQKRILANQFADQLFEQSANPKKFRNLITQIPFHCCQIFPDDCAYTAQITKRLRDQEPELWPALEALEKHLAQMKTTSEQVVHFSHQLQATNQVTVANIITSMRLISSLNWRDFFESVSLVDRTLAEDPIYRQMDFLTRDQYRHIIEKLTKHSKLSEIELAKQVSQLASKANQNDPNDQRQSHVGYYLIDQGIKKLEGLCNRTLNPKRFASTYPNLVYFSCFFTFLSIAFYFPLHYASRTANASLLMIAILAFIPASEFAIGLINHFLTHLIRPRLLPKLDLSDGIPLLGRTMVVIPCMLSSRECIRDLIERLEIHAIGNSDKNLYFALLTDFKDSKSETTSEDDSLLRFAKEEIERLNTKYQKKHDTLFFIFHRKRLWNAAEKHWMGWERKRGKLHEFNRLIRGDLSTSYLPHQVSADLLKSIRYIITLDADTQLQRDSARKLIGTILHPLNKAQFDEKSKSVKEGYGILQPRIGISLESSSKTFFAKIYSGFTGIDPYTTAVSDLYQDLFGEGNYAGKGLYDVDAFEASLNGRVRENTILSHDLFEGLFARTALVTDIELIDDYPPSYQSHSMREHRWIRGDWQIAHSLFSNNRLSMISRWKIFDNLRRSLVAPVSVIWFVLAWTWLPGSPAFWASYLFALLLFNSFLQLIVSKTKEHFKISLVQIFIYTSFLAHRAYLHLDAITRVCYRKLISKQKLLEWTAQADVEDLKSNSIIQKTWPTQISLLVISAILIPHYPQSIPAFYFIFLWMSYPLLANAVSKPIHKKSNAISKEDLNLLRQIARRTWHYFETYTDSVQNWLPPDNHQEFPVPVTAHRTSPTNIGLYLISLISARDFGYLNVIKFLRQLQLTFDSLMKLEKHEGHFLNWYDTKSLQPLYPKYISTVDSGNLAGYLLVAKQACIEIPHYHIVDTKILKGLSDVLQILKNEANLLGSSADAILTDVNNCTRLLQAPSRNEFTHWNLLLTTLIQSLEIAKSRVLIFKSNQPKKDVSSLLRWLETAIKQISEMVQDLSIFAPWNNFSERVKTHFVTLDQNVELAHLPSLYERALTHAHGIEKLISQEESERLLAAIQFAQANVNTILKDTAEAITFIEQLFTEMNFKFLLDPKREVFSVGYSFTDGKFDSGFYDLLGSEARLASFIAIAKEDVKQEHWFRLGRQLVTSSNGRALVSWTASMFEYLMPLLVLKDYENTLLDETARTVVARQISYGREHGVPWGVSEAGYHAQDIQLNYQYGPFGIPGLGLKRGLSHDLVISPYSTFLAAMINPTQALSNLKRLIRDRMLTNFGFYESIDYTRERLPDHKKFAVIQSFMAHHQGMILASINNVIHQRIIQDRFHQDPRVQATKLLLQERVPLNAISTLPKAAEIELEGPHHATSNPFKRHYSDPHAGSPRIQLLSNRTYSVMISTSGAGYSRSAGLAVTRWKEDATRDVIGSYIFLRDRLKQSIWSSTYQPLGKLPESYHVTFGEDKVEFKRRDGDISTYTQVLVAPEDNVEIRHLTITNHSEDARDLEITSYLEPVLGPAANDLDHLAFSKLFIQTEYLAAKKALLARRRKRSAHEQENWGFHVFGTDAEILGEIEYETDRAKFIGRGHHIGNAAALFNKKPLSNSIGSTLDPILSLRVNLRIPAKANIEIAFSTGIAKNRDEALELSDRYHDIHSFERESKLAWTKSQVDLRHLNIDSSTAYLFQKLAERILFSDTSLRPPTHHRSANINIQSSLWSCGISGDLPIVVVRINHQKEMVFVRTLLRCHEYLRSKGLIYDLVILNEQETTYYQELQDSIQQQIRGLGSQGWINKSGGVFVLRGDVTPKKVIAHIQSVSRVSLVADEPLKDQLERKTPKEVYPPHLQTTPLLAHHHDKSLIPIVPVFAHDFFNGYGGFSKSGKEYIITLHPGLWTPAPWINVIGNKLGFGFQISESGSGFTWALNSQANRLTPWSNDPVSDPPGEILYLRDDESGELWNPTPLPIRGESTYTIRHGHGYTTFETVTHGIQHELTQFVSKDEPIKISILKIKNLTNQTRKITLTTYTEWVLGTQREKTAPYLICDIDQNSKAIFARNPHDNEFASKMAFADLKSHSIKTEDGQPNFQYTCSRKEFIGRNGNYIKPEALKRMGLSKRKGTGHDPCAAIQTSFKIEPQEEKEFSVLLGQEESAELARALIEKYRNLSEVKLAFENVSQEWAKRIGTIQIKTPDLAMNTLMNGWLFYQVLSCRFWSRTAFYQSGGAYGFRDQLQDCMAFVYSAPHLAREHILRASEHQFKEGDVQHWWHPPNARGVRTRMSDDLLWLPFVTHFYLQVTGDRAILEEKTHFLEAPLLNPKEEDSYGHPQVSNETGTLFEHCIRAINRSLTLGAHQLPLMGTGDWNDGMNRVGFEGKGESVWLGWFLYRVLEDFIPYCDNQNLNANRNLYQNHLSVLKEALEKNAWDGNWYKRAFFDDGSPVGSVTSDECKIDSIAQSWAVISKAGDLERSKTAMNKVYDLLVKRDKKMVLLFSPPFDRSEKDPGYIKGYVPGVRENGGQYTHAAVWALMAFAELNEGEKAFELFQMLNPILHSQNFSDANAYKIEPYVIAADVYSEKTHEGQGGWSWYTGSSSWYYRAGLESILGFQLRANKLKLKPCIPKNWKEYEILYSYGKSSYSIEVRNPLGLNVGNISFELDGIAVQTAEVTLVDDGKRHKIIATLSEFSKRKGTHNEAPGNQKQGTQEI